MRAAPSLCRSPPRSRPPLAAALFTASGDDAPTPTHVSSRTQPLATWARGQFAQILRVNPGEMKLRNRCELTLVLDAPKPVALLGNAGDTVEAVAWTGASVSSGKLSATGCASYPCDLSVTMPALFPELEILHGGELDPSRPR